MTLRSAKTPKLRPGASLAPGMQTVAADLRSDLGAAVDLRELALTRALDHEFTASQGRIVYAVDSAILNYLLLGGGSGGRSHRSAQAEEAYQIFRGPSQVDGARERLHKAQSGLHQALLWYLVDGRVPSGSQDFLHLLTLPGHATELRRLYDGIVSDFHRQSDRLDRVKELASRFRALVGADAPTSAADELQAELLDLHVEMEEPHRRFSRINRLVQRKQVLSLSAAARLAIYQQDQFLAGQQNAFIYASQAPLRIDESKRPGSLSWWGNELHGKLPEGFAANDRVALSTLDLLNKSLDPTKARVVLFTDNTLIIDAGRSYFPHRGTKHAAQYGDLSFSDLYLRHPKTLLVDPDFIRHSDSATSSVGAETAEVTSWLETLLDDTLAKPWRDATAKPTETARKRPAATELLEFRANRTELLKKVNDLRRLQKAIRGNRRIHERFSTRWTTYVSALTGNAASWAPLTHDEVREFFSLTGATRPEAAQFEKLVDQVRERTQYLTEVSWSTFFNTAADMGLDLINLPSSDQPTPIYPVPPLYVRGDDTSELRAAIMSFWHPSRIARSPDPTDKLKALLDDDDAPLRNSYVHALCYGVLFAFYGRWSLTQLIAERAVRIARDIAASRESAPTALERISGREAYYLLAVALRVNAQTVDHFDEARAALKRARESKDDAGDKGELTRTLSGLRFATLDVAMDMAEATTRVRDKPSPEAYAKVGLVRTKVADLLARSQECLVERIRFQSRLALRSEYFLSFDVPKPRLGKGEIEAATNLVKAQVADMEAVFESLDDVPYRDRTLVQLAASTIGSFDRLPAGLQELSVAMIDRTAVPSASRSADRRRLARIETVIAERLTGDAISARKRRKPKG